MPPLIACHVKIYSQSWEDQLKQGAAILWLLEEAKLTTNLTKCCISKDEMTYLGYTLGKSQVQPLVDKVQA